MDEVLARKLSRQLRLLNSLIIFFSIVFLAIFAVAGVFVYNAVQEVRETKDSLTSLQSSAEKNLDFQSQLCDSSGSVATLLKNQSDICN